MRRTSSVLSVESLPPEEPADTTLAQASDPYADARTWIEAVLGEQLVGDSLHDALKSGVALCNLINTLQPRCCQPPSNRKLPFIQMENIGRYLKATTDVFGIPGFQSFMTVDLF